MDPKPPLTLYLAAPRGFCAGVDRAIKIVELALQKWGAPVYVRHEIVHNKFVVDGLRDQGAVFVEELDDVPDDRPVVFSAHGVPKAVPAEARRRNMIHVDATCPLVTKVHNEAARHHAEGLQMVMIGHAGHPEVLGTMGQLPEGEVILVETVEDFGNWYSPVAGGFEEYWNGRGTCLRNTVERKERALRRDHRVDLEVFRSPADAERATELYEHVHALSWKEPEPYPLFIPSLIRAGLEAGAVRVGVLTVDGEPVAAQLWIVWRGRATIFKLSYAENRRKLSAGSILTRHMVREAFRSGDVAEIDFGCGDDAYKKEWLPLRRQRWTLTAYDPTTACGAAHTLRRYLPRLIRRRLLGR